MFRKVNIMYSHHTETVTQVVCSETHNESVTYVMEMVELT